MKTKVILAGVLACMSITVKAQDAKVEEPKGKAIVQVFGNFHSGFGSSNDDRGFELERSYLGYEYKLNEGLSVKGLQIRLYGGLNRSGQEGKEDILNLTTFAGYKCDKFIIGAEYNFMQNASNTDGNNLKRLKTKYSNGE